MKITKIIKDEVYVLRQPKHLVATIINVYGNYPLSEEVHKGLDKLSTVSDIIFIFSDFHFKEENSKINKLKFSNLYGATCFIDSNNSIGESVFKLLNYTDNIFNKYLGYIFTDTKIIVPDNVIKLIPEVTSSSIIKPILKIRKLTSSEFFDIYKRESLEKKELSIFQNMIKTIFYPLETYESEFDDTSLKNLQGMYSSYTSESNLIFIKTPIIKLILLKYRENELNDIIQTFNSRYNLRYLISSIIKLLDIDNLNIDFENLEINKIE